MRRLKFYCSILQVIISLFLITSTYNTIYAQDTVKHKVRLKADYFKVMNGEIIFKLAQYLE